MRGRFVDRRGRLGLPRPAGGDRGREAPRHLGQAADRGLRHRRVQRAVPRVGAGLRRRVGAPDRAHRLLDRHRARLPHDGRRRTSRASGGASPSCTGAACSTRATRSCPTARAAAPPCRATRSPSATRRSTTPRSTCASALRDEPGRRRCWSGPPPRGRCRPTRRRRSNPDVTYAAVEREGETLILAERLVERVLGEGARVAAPGARAGAGGPRATSPRSRTSTAPHAIVRRRLRDDRGRHRHRPHRAGLRRGRHGRRPPARLLARRTRSAPTGATPTPSARGRGGR